MNFIRIHSSAVDEKTCNEILEYGINHGLEAKLMLDTIDLINSYIALNKENDESCYYYRGIKIVSLMDKFTIIEKNDDEIVTINEEELVKNFSILVCLQSGNECYIEFPFQNEKIEFKQGSVIIYPSSFMFPYKVNKIDDIKFVEIEYYFDKNRIIGSEETRTKQYIV